MKQRSLGGHQRITLMLLFAAGLINFLDRSSLSIASSTIQREMHLDSTQIGVLLTAFSLAYGFAQLPQNFASFMIASAAPVLTGWLLDRTHFYSLALGVCSAVTLLGALSYATLASPDGMHLAATIAAPYRSAVF